MCRLNKEDYRRCYKGNGISGGCRKGSSSGGSGGHSGEPSELIELDSDDENDSDGDAYAAFKDINDIKAIGVEDKGDFVLD